MEYAGRYPIFDPSRITTYPVRTRANKVHIQDLVRPQDLPGLSVDTSHETRKAVEAVAAAVRQARQTGKPVLLFTGAHLIKNGLGPLLADMVRRSLVTLVAGNMATAIHDFELALLGQTSEDVPNALGAGQFGMAYEFAYINAAIAAGDARGWGLGELLGRMICDEGFRREVLAPVAKDDRLEHFPHKSVSVIAACHECGVPLTIHAGVGTDVIDQHPSFDGRAKGGCSGRDFLIYTHAVAGLGSGGVVINIGSAVTGPEVLLKAVSMAANVGAGPRGIVTADFDIREHHPAQMTDESTQGYYFRDQKSVLTRIPQAFAGRGYYVQGDQKQTFVLLYRMLTGMD